MIQIKNGWAQYDDQLGTFRALVGNSYYGNYTNEYPTAQLLGNVIGLDSNQINDLSSEGPIFKITDITLIPIEYLIVDEDKIKSDLQTGSKSNIPGISINAVALSFNLDPIQVDPIQEDKP